MNHLCVVVDTDCIKYGEYVTVDLMSILIFKKEIANFQLFRIQSMFFTGLP